MHSWVHVHTDRTRDVLHSTVAILDNNILAGFGLEETQKANGGVPKVGTLGTNDLSGDTAVAPNNSCFSILDGTTTDADKADIVTVTKDDAHDRL